MGETSDTPDTPFLHRLFPEKRIFVKSDAGTRFVRLGPRQHILAGAGLALLVGWTTIATSVLVIDLIRGDGAHQQVLAEQRLYEDRITTLAAERDRHRRAALDAQARYDEALAQLSTYQDDIFDAQRELHALAESRAALHRILTDTMAARDAAQARLAAIETAVDTGDVAALARARDEADSTVAFLTDALDRTAAERDAVAGDAADALAERADLEREIARIDAENERIFSQLEEAVTLAMEPLGTMFEEVGLPPDRVLDQMRRQYSGQGGPLTPIAYSAKNRAPTPSEMRANAILTEMDALNLYRMAADKVPFATPVGAGVRLTSDFGYRRDPFNGGTRMHNGIDWAGRHGTPIAASAEGVVTFAGWQSGYGRMVKIRHAFGIETRFAHLARIDVRVGQKVSRGDRIGAMGNSGRSTGTHLHYEVRVGGKAVDPMTYIKAARHVF